MVAVRALLALLCAAIVVTLGISPASATTPSQVLNLTDWKLQLPVDQNGGTTGAARDVYPIGAQEFSPWFLVPSSEPTRVYFRAQANGATTSANTSYARSELREMKNGGEASWNPDDGLQHVMSITQAITALPGTTKRELVAGQIHDGLNDVLQIRLEGARLFASLDNGRDERTLDSDYRLGTPFELRIVVNPSGISVTYNGVPKVSNFRPLGAGNLWHFKAGAYTQSNESGTYSEVAISALIVEHRPVPQPPPSPTPTPTPPPAAQVFCAGQIATQAGSGNGEVLYGTAGNDVIAAGEGNDVVYGLGGDDIICGGPGNDTIKAGAGTDQLYGEDGADKLVGGAGTRDLCNGGPARDRAKGCEVKRGI